MEKLLLASEQGSGVLILDGAFATQLEQHGVTLHDTLWSADCLRTHPALIQQIHLDYLNAGANIISTATYQASCLGFQKVGVPQEESLKLIELGIVLADSARAQFLSKNPCPLPLIAVSLGPYGAYLPGGQEYNGSYGTTVPADELVSFHEARFKTVASHPKTDLILFETFPCLTEAVLAAEMAQRLAPSVPILISFSCKDDSHLCSGETISSATVTMNNYSNVVGLGVNCCSPVFVPSLVQAIKTSTNKKFIACYPNLGEKYDAEKKDWVVTNSGELGGLNLEEVLKAGANIVGGCCRTTPASIQQIKEQLKSILENKQK